MFVSSSLFASLPICFPYNHSPIAPSPCVSCLALAALFPTDPSASSFLLPLSFPSAFCTIFLLYSLINSLLSGKKGAHTGVFLYRNISSLKLCACIQVGWLLGREIKLLCKLFALQTCKGTRYLEIPCWFTKMYWILPKFSKVCNSDSLVLQSPLCLETIHSMTDSYMSVMQRTRIQAKVKCQACMIQIYYKSGKIK